MKATRSLLPFTEVALAVVTLAATATFWRLFDDRSFLGPLAILAIAAHLTVAACRRAGLGLPTSAAVTATATAIVTTWVLYPSTSSYGLPTSLTLDTARADLAEAWTMFSDVSAPAPVETGYLLAAGLAIWVTAFIADWAAFRLWVPFEAIVPAATLWLFASLLGADNSRVQATLLFVCCILAFALMHRTVRQHVSSSWLASDITRGTQSLLRVGGWLVAGALVIAAVIGPLLPGARTDAWLDWRNIGDSNSSGRSTVSPLISVRGQLTERSRVEMFTVRSAERSYWRLTALDTFDGELWRSNYRYRGVDATLPDRYESNADVEVAEQAFTVRALSALWLPAAYEARTFQAGEGAPEARWDPESSTLIVESGFNSSDGAEYIVESALPRLEQAALASSEAVIPPDVAERYLDLPGDFSDRVRDLAGDVVAGATTPYEQARALQDFFRTNFDYSLEGVPAGHDGNAMEAFLFELGRGYCEQFSSTFAAMARAVGLPSRVAVGFTPGERDPDDPNLFHVRGEHAHAWPEVFIAGYGWVPFEPTPNRGIPNAEDYTGVPEQQAESGSPGTATTVPATQATQPQDDPGEAAVPLPDGGLGVTAGAGTEGSEDRRSWWEPWIGRVAWTAAGVLVLAVLYLVVVPLSHLIRRRTRRTRATGPSDQVRVAWEESVEALAVLGVDARRSETPAEFAARSGTVVPVSYTQPLAASLAAVEYSPDGVSAEEGLQALVLSDNVIDEVRRKATRQQLLRAALDPRAVHRRRDGQRGRLARRPKDDQGPRVELVNR